MARPDTTQLQALLESARHVTVLLPQKPHYDAVASGLSLKLALETTGKTALAACSDLMTVEFNELVGIDTIAATFGNRHLVISFPGQTEHVDKVSYNIDQGELQLIVTPKSGAPDLDHRRLKFIPATAQSDLLILVGVDQLLDLGQIYHDAKDVLASSRTVSLTVGLPKENYTPHQLYDPEASSLSELTVHIIESLSLNLHTDIASNLLSGLEKATDFFKSPHVSHSTFETAAHLLRRGARRRQPLSASDYPAGSIPTQPYTPAAAPASSNLGYGTDSAQPITDKPPADWYEPKIYRGPMLP